MGNRQQAYAFQVRHPYCVEMLHMVTLNLATSQEIHIVTPA